jgi:hypothetical protein
LKTLDEKIKKFEIQYDFPHKNLSDVFYSNNSENKNNNNNNVENNEVDLFVDKNINNENNKKNNGIMEFIENIA